MGVKLIGENYNIKPLSERYQIIRNDQPAIWEWDVIPLKTGKQSLKFLVTLKIDIPEHGEEIVNYPIIKEEIIIHNNPLYVLETRIKGYISITATMVVIFSGLIGIIVGIRAICKKKKAGKKKS